MKKITMLAVFAFISISDLSADTRTERVIDSVERTQSRVLFNISK